MTKKDYTEIVIVLDRSYSMTSIVGAMKEGFDSFIADQKKLNGKCSVTLFQFNDDYERVYAGLDVNEVPPLKLEPSGNTALLGALGKAIDETGARLASMREDDRPERVLFLVITDGEENYSHMKVWSMPYTHERVMSMIQHQTTKYSWSFVYIGANQDAIKVGAKLGIDLAFNYQATDKDTKQQWGNISVGTTNYRSKGSYTH